MANESKQAPNGGNLLKDLKALVSVLRARRTTLFLTYAFMFVFIACTVLLAFNPGRTSSPWINRIFSPNSDSYKSQFSSLLSRFFPDSQRTIPHIAPPPLSSNTSKEFPARNQTQLNHDTTSSKGASARNQTQLNHDIPTSKGVPARNQTQPSPKEDPARNQTQSCTDFSISKGVPAENQTQQNPDFSSSREIAVRNQTQSCPDFLSSKGVPAQNQTQQNSDLSSSREIVARNQTQPSSKGVPARNETQSSSKEVPARNQTQSSSKGVPARNQTQPSSKEVPARNQTQLGVSSSNYTAALMKRNGTAAAVAEVSGKQRNGTIRGSSERKWEKLADSWKHCDIFDGKWVKDESYPLYPGGSCPLIDESFDCFLNGRQDHSYQKLRWKPNRCEIPRLNATDMLERLRGKRLVFVGDSLNRNMWESLVCILRNSVQDKRKVFEASGRKEFRTEGSYAFVFKDYNCSVEFFRSPFLVREWEAPESNGTTKETLRLDLIERHSSKYKNADVIIFNTGHWWTHEKTSKGKDYYQEGSHIYGKLNVVEAFRKALTTWARWVDANVNPNKTQVFFRGYSASHFSGGQWNSGGACDRETEPIKNEKYLAPYPPKMNVLERVIRGTKMPINYLNITRLTDYRKDAHPSIYRKKKLTPEERRSPERYQDCSHWCLPGVPDIWNELLYAQLLIKLGRH